MYDKVLDAARSYGRLPAVVCSFTPIGVVVGGLQRSMNCEFGGGAGRAPLPMTRSGSVEYCGCDTRLLADCDFKAKERQLQEQLSSFVQDYGERGKCRMQLEASPNKIQVLIRYKDPRPSARPGFEARHYGSRKRSRESNTHSIVYHRRTGRLVITARSPKAQNHYRRMFGQVFWGDAEHFSRVMKYTGAPLVERGVALLEGLGVHIVRRMVITRIDFATDSGSSRVTLIGSDLDEQLRSPGGLYLLRYWNITAFRMNLVFGASRRSLQVKVVVPNCSVFESAPFHGKVEELFAETGILLRDPIEEDFVDWT